MRILAMSGWVMQTVRGVFENVGVVQESMATIARPHGLIDRPDARPLTVLAWRGAVRAGQLPLRREEGVIDDLSFCDRAGRKRSGSSARAGRGNRPSPRSLEAARLEGGRILIDGQDIARVTQDSLRRHIAVVTQDTSLLHRSIRDNIAYGNPEASEEGIERAAALAHAEEFIAELEDDKGRRGLEARVGERGVKLSGGQRQRIAIARVILKNAPILVLDEATSALDSEVEAAIQEALAALMEGKT
jgi:ATP-binding cassette subfamily B multidrug efflux pump